MPEAASRAGRSIVWIAIGTSIAWRWIRLIWTPFEQWTLENDNPDLIKARGPMDAFRLWFTQLRKWLKIEKPELKPYQYSQQPSPKKPEQTTSSNKLDPIEKELLRYQSLLSRGVITQQEYEEMRRRVLGL